MDRQIANQVLEKVESDYNRIGQSFSETRSSSWNIMKQFARDIPEHAKILDVGCGNGRLLDLFEGRTIEYVGVDVSATLIDEAQKRSRAFFSIANVLHLPFPDASCDAVFCIAVLHHIPSTPFRQQAMHEMARVLKPGGKLIMTNWNLYALQWIRRYRLHLRGLLVPFPPYDRGDCFIPWKRGEPQAVKRYVHAFLPYEIRAVLLKSGLSLRAMWYERRGEHAHIWNGDNLVTEVQK